jgi:hypothetical protein
MPKFKITFSPLLAAATTTIEAEDEDEAREVFEFGDWVADDSDATEYKIDSIEEIDNAAP